MNYSFNYNVYYPYGMLLNNRHGSVDSDAYRYGFQGQERDDEVKGEGNSYNYTFRMHDPRLVRFFAVDSLAESMPEWSAYAYTFNNPIKYNDPSGMIPENAEGTENCPPCFEFLFAQAKQQLNNLGEKIRNFEPDDINVNNLGFDFGAGVKKFKLGPLGRVTVEGSLFSIAYDKNNDEINLAGLSGSLGFFLGNKDIGLSVSGETVGFGLMNQSLTAGTFEAEANFLDFGLDDTTSVNGAHLGNFSLFDNSERDSWFNGSIGSNTSENRMITIDGEQSSMFIIGGEFKLGIRGEFEWIVDQTASRFLGGTGLGSEWKRN